MAPTLVVFPRLLACPALLLLVGCRQASHEDLAGTAARRLRADVAFLAADELEGRGTPSRGLDLAALYLESQLRAAGVEPAVSGSFRQSYLIGSYAPDKAKVDVRIDGRAVSPSNYVFLNFGRDPQRGPMALPLVRTGNGIVLEEKNVNDLYGLALRGKAAVAQRGAPWPLDATAVFGPDRAMGKLMAATVRGAELLIYLSDALDGGPEAEAGFFRQMRHAGVSFVRDGRLRHASALNPLLVLKPAAMPKDGARVIIQIDAPVEEGRALNVLGMVRGADPTLRDEWVVLTAHYDHIGSHPVAAGEDGIWNGADDNASGTAAVLELARRIARQPTRRSVLVFFTSGEDRGMLGSAYYAIAPVVPMNRVVLQLNLDMIGRSQGQVEAIAPQAPELFAEAVALGKQKGIQVIADRQPGWRLLYLTDTYHFARHQVPGIFFFTGLHADYHQPSDTAEKIRYEEMARIVEIALEIVRKWANSEAKPAFSRPVWFVTP